MSNSFLRRRVGAVIAPLLLVSAACGSSDTDSATQTDAAPIATPGVLSTDPIPVESEPPDIAPAPDTTIDGTEAPQSPATEPPTTETSATEAPPTDTATTDPSDDSTDGVGSEFCGIGQELEGLDFDLTASPEDLQATFDEFFVLADEAITVAPDRFRPFLERTTELQEAFYELLERNDFDFDAAATDPDGEALASFDTLDEDFPGVEAELDVYCGFGVEATADGSLVGDLPLDGDDVDGAAVCGYLELLDLDALVGVSVDGPQASNASCSIMGESASVNLVISQNSAAANYDNSAELLGVETELPDLGTKGFASGPSVVVLADGTLVSLQIVARRDAEAIATEDRIAAMETILEALASA